MPSLVRREETRLHDLIEEAVRTRNAGALCAYYFGADLTPNQARIAAAIAFRLRRRVAIRGMTQWGKSHAVAAGVCLSILLWRGLKMAIVAPRIRQAKIIRDLVAANIIASPHLSALLDLKATGIARLDKEVSKNRLVFSDGTDLEILSCEGDAERLLGLGSYDLLVEDESGLIPEEINRAIIKRMLSKAGAIYVKIGNPWRKGTHFHRACTDASYEVFKIDWRVAIQEGRVSLEFIEEQRRDLTPSEFQVLYEAEFPDVVDGGLFTFDVIDRCRRLPAATDGRAGAWGIDVAEGGTDFTVLTGTWPNASGPNGTKQWTFKNADLEIQADLLCQVLGPPEGCAPITVDSVGVGKGLGDILRRRGYRVNEFKSSEKPDDPKRFQNRKAEAYWKARVILESGRVSTAGCDPKTHEQLGVFTYDTDLGKVRVDRPEGKSPDHADSLILCIAGFRIGPAPSIKAW